MPSAHRLWLGLPGYLIPFAPPAFVFQCQDQTAHNPKIKNCSAPHTRNTLESRLRHRHSSRYPRILPLHREFHSPLVSSILIVSNAVQPLSGWISHLTHQDTYTPFTPSDSGQRSPPPYYRGCWHGVSRGFLEGYRHYRSPQQRFTFRRTSSLTRRRWVRLSPIAQISRLLPPVGVGTVSQFPCGGSCSHTP